MLCVVLFNAEVVSMMRHVGSQRCLIADQHWLESKRTSPAADTISTAEKRRRVFLHHLSGTQGKTLRSEQSSML